MEGEDSVQLYPRPTNQPVGEGAMFCCSCGSECSSSAHFCTHCGHRINDAIEQTSTDSVDVGEVIREYFHRGYPYNAIVGLLEKQNGVRMHVRTLKRKLKDLGLKRRGCSYDEDLLRDLIKLEMQGAGALAGYRYIWHSLRLKHYVNVPRSFVASIMKEIDPEGVKERRATRLKRRAYVSEGPNFCWHIDGGSNYY